ncbi:MAG: polysaccharide deacetylase family protein [Actinobacteria bacterium]|nr:polysaccharide deacetylase family protein [Actinomycetota bacterium]
MNKAVKIFLFTFIAVIVIAGTYLGMLGIIKYRKDVQHKNLIKSETEKYNTPNFKDSSTTSIKLPENKEIEPSHFINYEINYKNSGKQEIENLIIEASIPENCTLVERYLKGLQYSINSDKLLIKIGNLGVGSGDKINLILLTESSLDNGLKIPYPSIKFKYFKENKIIAKSGYFNDDIISEGSLTVKSSPDLSGTYIIIDDSGKDMLEKTLGDEFVYIIVLINNGNMTAKNISLKLSDLKNLNFPGGKNKDFTIDGNSASASIPELKAGKEKTFYLYAAINKDSANNTEIVPMLEINVENFKSISKTAPKVIVKLFPVFSDSSMKLTDRNGGSTYSGEIVDAMIMVKNTGQMTASNVKIKLNLSNLFSIAEGQTDWEINKLEAGAQATFNCSLKVSDGVTSDTNAYCNFSISSDESVSFTSSNYVIKVTGAKPFTRYVIPIIGFHEVEPVIGNPIELSSGCFDILCATLKSYGYQTITFQDLLDYLDYGKSLPEKPVILSSDDGYQDIYTYAFPILKKYGYKMTVFLVTNLIGNSETDRQTNIFDKNVSGVQVRPMLIWPEIKAMNRYGCEFLSHTANHIRLGSASVDQILNELAVSKNAIESHLGKPCVFFSWPYDNYSDTAASLISKAGYRGGVVYGGGIEDIRAIDLRKIRRVPINGYNDAAGYIKLLNLQ